jgi:uncharacterized membrane protein YeaQ/YmgE (transglycosylase-associated protein family)
MDILRMIVGMIGAILAFVGLISVWGTWMSKESTSGPWLLTIFGAVMFLQALPVMRAQEREETRRLMRERRNKK